MKVRGIVIANVLMLWMGGTLGAQTPAAATADSRVFLDGTLGADYDQNDFVPPGPTMAPGFDFLGPKHPVSAFQRTGRFRNSPHRCSKVKAAFIGAAVGFGAGAVYGAVAGPSQFGILGTRQKTDVLLFGTIGAGAGALVGVAFCS